MSNGNTNWSDSQTVTVRGVNDDIDNDPARMATISHTVSGAGTDYASGVSVESVTVTSTDDDTRGVGLSTRTLAVGENAQTQSYTVVLDSEPTGTVTVSMSNGNTNVVTVSPSSLSFSTGNWNASQTVTVRGVNDDIDNDPARMATISHTVSGAGTDYASGVSVESVTVTATDDDTRGVGLSTRTLAVGENAQTQSYTVVLDSEPTGTVTVSMSNGNTNVVTVSPSSLSFSTGNWNASQTVTVRGVNDNIVNNPARTATISHTVSGPGTDYASGVSAESVTVTSTDDDDELTVVITGPTGPLNGNIDLMITFSGGVSNFVKGDITVSSGILGSLADGGNGVFTITLTPAANTDTSVTVDIAANMATAVATSIGNTVAPRYSVEVDNVLPAIVQQNIGVPTNGTYQTGGNLDFTVQFSEDVLVEGAPYLSLYVGTGTITFDSNESSSYLSGSGGNTLTFRYTIEGGDTDADGVTVSNRHINVDAGGSIKDVAGNLILINGSSNKFKMDVRHLSGVIVDTSLRENLVLQDHVAWALPGEQTSSLAFDPGRIEGLDRWLDGGDPKTLFSDLFCTTPLGRGENSMGCWSDKSGRADHYLPVLSMEWPTLSDILAAEGGRKSGELFVVQDREGKVDVLSFVYPYPTLEEETSHNPGEIREVVIYESVLGESERGELEGYLTCRWQLPFATVDCL